jgi:hypothetical protein
MNQQPGVLGINAILAGIHAILVRIRLLSLVTDAKNLFFFIFFTYNLPAGTLSSVLKLKIDFLLKFCVKISFCKHYFSPLNTFMTKSKDPEPDPDL